MAALASRGIAWAGLALGPAAWALNQLGSYAAVPWICAHRINLAPILAVAFALVALAGSFISWRSYQVEPEPPTDGAGGVPRVGTKIGTP